MTLINLLKRYKHLKLDQLDLDAYGNKSAYVKNGRVCINIDGNYKYLSRVIMGCPDNLVVDHIDGNTRDNTRANLRVCTQHQNTMNSRKTAGNSTGYKGVTLVKCYNKYKAQLTFNGKNIQSHLFKTAEAAAKWYDEKARELFGEFADTNFHVEELLS